MDTVVLRQRITRLEETYGTEIAELAAYIHMTKMFHSCVRVAYRQDTASLQKMFCKLVEAFCIDRDIYPPQVEAAVHELENDVQGARAAN